MRDEYDFPPKTRAERVFDRWFPRVLVLALLVALVLIFSGAGDA